MELPNKENLWTWGMSLSPYSKPYRESKGIRALTTQGENVNFFKYHDEAGKSQLKAISKDFTKEVFALLTKELSPKFPNKTNLPFDVCVGIPENRRTGRSLPKDICKLLVEEVNWIKNGSEGVTKTRHGLVIKNIAYDERPAKVAGLYAIDRTKMPVPKFGFLIIDDVFETGSTIGGLCKILEEEYPGIPRYIITLTHLHATERMAK